jgi:hypothetical protein
LSSNTSNIPFALSIFNIWNEDVQKEFEKKTGPSKTFLNYRGCIDQHDSAG